MTTLLVSASLHFIFFNMVKPTQNWSALYIVNYILLCLRPYIAEALSDAFVWRPWTLSAVRRWRSCSSARFQHGWRQIDCSWISPRPRSSGAPHLDVNTWSRPHLFVSVMFWCHRPVTAVRDLGVYIDTDVTMRTRVTSIVQAFFSTARSGVCDVPCHSTHC